VFLNNTRNETIRNSLNVLIPHLTVLGSHQVLITKISVNQHKEVEGPVQEGQKVTEAARSTPDEGLNGVSSVVDLASLANPSVDEDFLSTRSLDGLGVVEGASGEVRESLTANDFIRNTVAHHAEAVLLADGSVEDVVSGAENDDERPEEEGVEFSCGANLEDEEGLDTVEDGDTSEVPEDEHPAELFVVNIPAGGNAFFALLAGVAVQEVAKHQQPHSVGDLAVSVVHLEGVGKSDEEEVGPRDAEFGNHLEIDAEGELGVEAGSHEEVVDAVASQTDGALGDVAPDEDHDRDDVADDDGRGEVLTVVVGDLADVPDTSVPETENEGEHDVPGRDGIASVRVAVSTFRGNGAAKDDGAWHNDGETPFEEEEGQVGDEATSGGNGVFDKLLPKGREERLALESGVASVDDFTVPAVDAGEGVVDEEVREKDDEGGAGSSTEFPGTVPLVLLGGPLEGGSGTAGDDGRSTGFCLDTLGLSLGFRGGAARSDS